MLLSSEIKGIVILNKLFLKAPSYLTSLGYPITPCLRFLALIALVSSLLYVAYKYELGRNDQG